MHVIRQFVIAAGLSLGTLAPAHGTDLPDAPGRQQVIESCSQCHSIDLLAQRRSADDWSQIVSQMVGQGAKMTDEQFQTILDYLSTHMTPAKSAPAGKAGR
jgi:mono/diheme cytochrome c family protein